MNRSELLDQLRGDMTKGDFAERLGISDRMLTALYAGNRNAGRAVLKALIGEFPERRQEIVDVFLLSDENDCSSVSTKVPEAAS